MDVQGDVRLLPRDLADEWRGNYALHRRRHAEGHLGRGAHADLVTKSTELPQDGADSFDKNLPGMGRSDPLVRADQQGGADVALENRQPA
jgi:hypothetical protein